jgi:hypothetical protein
MVNVTSFGYELDPRWAASFAPVCATRARTVRSGLVERRHLDEIFVSIGG